MCRRSTVSISIQREQTGLCVRTSPLQSGSPEWPETKHQSTEWWWEPTWAQKARVTTTKSKDWAAVDTSVLSQKHAGKSRPVPDSASRSHPGSSQDKEADVTCALLRHGVSGLPYQEEEQRTDLGLAGDIISLTLAWEWLGDWVWKRWASLLPMWLNCG